MKVYNGKDPYGISRMKKEQMDEKVRIDALEKHIEELNQGLKEALMRLQAIDEKLDSK